MNNILHIPHLNYTGKDHGLAMLSVFYLNTCLGMKLPQVPFWLLKFHIAGILKCN